MKKTVLFFGIILASFNLYASCDVKQFAPEKYGLQIPSKKITFKSYEKLNWTHLMKGTSLPAAQTSIPGLLMPPASTKADGKYPVVVLMHGSSGINSYHYDYVKALREKGYGVFMFDAFCARGISSTVGDQSSLSTVTTVADAYKALAALGAEADVDINQVSIMGTSRGGSVSVLAADQKMIDRFSVDKQAFQNAIGVYPGCMSDMKQKTPSRTRVLMQLGSQDQYFPPTRCQETAADMKKNGFDVSIQTYNAEHGWDGGGGVTTLPNEYNYNKCHYQIDLDKKSVVETNSGVVLKTTADANAALKKCAVMGTRVAGNKEVKQKSLKALLEYLPPPQKGPTSAIPSRYEAVSDRQ